MSHTNDIDKLIQKKLNEALGKTVTVNHLTGFIKSAESSWDKNVGQTIRQLVKGLKRDIKPSEDIYVIFTEYDRTGENTNATATNWKRPKNMWFFTDDGDTSLQSAHKVHWTYGTGLGKLKLQPKLGSRTVEKLGNGDLRITTLITHISAD